VTYFLAAGFIPEELEIMQQAAHEARTLTEGFATEAGSASLPLRHAERLQYLIGEFGRRCDRLCELIDRLHCEPLIYTGTGATQEVIDRLERLLCREPAGPSAPDGVSKINVGSLEG